MSSYVIASGRVTRPASQTFVPFKLTRRQDLRTPAQRNPRRNRLKREPLYLPSNQHLPGYERSQNFSFDPSISIPPHSSIQTVRDCRHPLRELRCGTPRACRPQPLPPGGGTGRGTVTAARVRGCRPGIERSRKRRKQGCVLVPRKPLFDRFRDDFEQPCSARPSHLGRSPNGAHPKASAAPCGRPGLGIDGVCDTGLRPRPFGLRAVQPQDEPVQIAYVRA